MSKVHAFWRRAWTAAVSELLGDVLLQPFRSVEAFLDAGGVVLWGIFSVGIVLWTLILERFWYYWRLYPRARRQWQDEWALRPERRSWAARRVRTAILGEAELELSSTLPIIGNLIAICPLLGLMGTVTGMIQVFDVMPIGPGWRPVSMVACPGHVSVAAWSSIASTKTRPSRAMRPSPPGSPSSRRSRRS